MSPAFRSIDQSVSFDSNVEIIEFDPTEPVAAGGYPWPHVDVGFEECGITRNDFQPESCGDPTHAFHSGSYKVFWDEWHSAWLQVEGLLAMNGPLHCSHCNGCGLDCQQCQCLSTPPLLVLRNEDDPAPAIRADPVDNPRGFVPGYEDDHDSDNDLGVSFFRWPDVLLLVDLQPYRQGANIPFITYGLREFHLGRRDFSSPDMSPSRLRGLIWNRWQDEVRPFEEVVLHFVRPQPVAELGSAGIVVLIVEILTDSIPPRSSPVLAVTCDNNNHLLESPRAMYVPRAVDTATLLSQFSMSYLCSPRGFRRCDVFVASSPVGPYLAPVPEGAMIKLVVGARLRIFAQAVAWFPDLERFASVVREAIRTGNQDHVLALHSPGSHEPALVQFRMADALAPPRFRNAMQV